MNNAVVWDVIPCGSCKTDVSEGCNASIIKVIRIGEIGTTLKVIGNRSKLQRNIEKDHIVTAMKTSTVT
jgi:hypothetical protein